VLLSDELAKLLRSKAFIELGSVAFSFFGQVQESWPSFFTLGTPSFLTFSNGERSPLVKAIEVSSVDIKLGFSNL
jgi:hypothetical protein